MRAVAGDTFVHGASEGRLRPGADAGLRIGRDVGRIEYAERRCAWDSHRRISGRLWQCGTLRNSRRRRVPRPSRSDPARSFAAGAARSVRSPAARPARRSPGGPRHPSAKAPISSFLNTDIVEALLTGSLRAGAPIVVSDTSLCTKCASGRRPAQTRLIATSMLPRVAREYGHIRSASFTMACANSRSTPGRLTLRLARRK